MIEVASQEQIQLVGEKVSKFTAQLSLQKYASNVLDKLIPHCELFGSLDVKDLLKMIQSQFGNLVL